MTNLFWGQRNSAIKQVREMKLTNKCWLVFAACSMEQGFAHGTVGNQRMKLLAINNN